MQCTELPELRFSNLHTSNNRKFANEKSRSRNDIEELVFSRYKMRKPDKKGKEYELKIPYENDKDLKKMIYEMMNEASNITDLHNGFIEADVMAMDGSGRSW